MDRPDSPSPQPGASPIKAFLIIFALIILTTAIFLMTANGEETTDATRSPSTNSTPDFSLTDEEAIARFEELNDLRLKSYADRDVSLVGLYVTSDGPLNPLVRREIRRLLRANVLDRTTFVTKSLDVSSNDSDEIEITQRVVESPKFIDETGEDVTAERFRELRTVEWILKPEDGIWKVYEIRVTDAKIL